jgi:hypothetical protein
VDVYRDFEGYLSRNAEGRVSLWIVTSLIDGTSWFIEQDDVVDDTMLLASQSRLLLRTQNDAGSLGSV